jgi:hypothetical protein
VNWWRTGSKSCTVSSPALTPGGCGKRRLTHSGSTRTRSREGRRERLAEATPFVPLPLWFVLGIGASLTNAYMCAQADRREGVLIHSIPIGFVTALVTAGMLVVVFLDHPYAGGSD